MANNHSIYSDIQSNLVSKNKDVKIVTDAQAVKNAIKNLLQIRKGDIPGKPEYGTLIKDLIFSQMDMLAAIQIEEEVRVAIDRWEPRVSLISVNTVFERDTSSIIIELTFKLVKNNEVESMNIKIGE